MAALPSDPDARLEDHAGPYERWTFSDRLGRPFSFPDIAGAWSGLATAIHDGPVRETGDAAHTAVRIPPLWHEPYRAPSPPVTPLALQMKVAGPPTPNGPPVDAVVQRMLAEALGEAPRIGAFRVNVPIPEHAWPNEYCSEAKSRGWERPARPPRAVIAVIDDGLPFAHRAFLGADGRTRVSHVWLQSAAARLRPHGAATDIADPVPFGREWTNGEIDALRGTLGHDERALYRHAWGVARTQPHLGQPMRRHATHGAHVMGIAAGNDASMVPHAPMPDDIAIVAVQLPDAISWDTSGFGKEAYLLSALHYVFHRAERIAAHCEVRPLPLVVNLSYGWSAGPHDGRSPVERGMQDLLERRNARVAPTAIVVPTGNTFEADLHASLTAKDFGSLAVPDGPDAPDAPDASERTVSVGWRLQPDDRTSSYLEVWFPEGTEGWTVALDPPDGAALDAAASVELAGDADAPGSPRTFVDLGWRGRTIGQLSADGSDGRWRVLVALAPTAYTRGEDRRAPAGTWRVRITGKPWTAADGSAVDSQAQDVLPRRTLGLWVQRDDDPVALRMHGRQSRLTDVDGDRGRIDGFGSLSGIATAPAATRVAGFDAATGRAAPYSSVGRRGGAAPVDMAAASDRSPARPGVRSIGVTSGTGAVMVGTSAAAPAAARHMAINAAGGLPFGHGFAECPDGGQHAARLGNRRVPPAVRTG